jgi:hypothetical protein
MAIMFDTTVSNVEGSRTCCFCYAVLYRRLLVSSDVEHVHKLSRRRHGHHILSSTKLRTFSHIRRPGRYYFSSSFHEQPACHATEIANEPNRLNTSAESKTQSPHGSHFHRT